MALGIIKDKSMVPFVRVYFLKYGRVKTELNKYHNKNVN